jgi:hypothetical protein
MVDPLFLDGMKFDFRLFHLISSLDPFSVFIYREGIAIFCTAPYAPPMTATRNDKIQNLTNRAVNVGSLRPPEEFIPPASIGLEKLKRIYPDTVG